MVECAAEAFARRLRDCHRGQVRELGRAGLPLGVELEADDQEERAPCPSGSILVAYTDGVGEAASPSDQAFGYDRWRQMLPDLEDAPASAALDILLAAVDSHRRGRPATDDVTAVVIRCGAATTSSAGAPAHD